VIEYATGSRMLTALVVLLRSIGLICRGHRAVALENLAFKNTKNDGRDPSSDQLATGRRANLTLSRSPRPWPVLTCPQVAGFEVSTEVGW
jgi:hypothetical protein